MTHPWNKYRISRWQRGRGFTLVEVMLSSFVLVIALVGLLATYVNLFGLSETSRNLSLALCGAHKQLEEIKNVSFEQIWDYKGMVFDISNLDGKGRIDIYDTIYSDLKQVRIVVCWRQRQTRVIGEDENLNGRLDPGEDKNSNGRLDSPCEIVTFIAR